MMKVGHVLSLPIHVRGRQTHFSMCYMRAIFPLKCCFHCHDSKPDDDFADDDDDQEKKSAHTQILFSIFLVQPQH